jgi:hypothetical protein
VKLSITRPKMNWLEYTKPTRRGLGYDIAIDGRFVRSIDPGETIELELSRGHHEVRARSSFFGSRPVEIDGNPNETRRFAIGFSARWQKLNLLAGVFVILSILPMIGISLSLSHQMRPRVPAAVDRIWLSVMLISIIFLSLPAMLFQLFVLVFYRNRGLDLQEIPGPELTHPQIAEFLRSQPLRLRITIRHSMIAVAILAVLIAATIQWLRHERSNDFRRDAERHADLEALSRKFEHDRLRIAGDLETSSALAARLREDAGKAAAKAAYHDALKRKYEQAAAQGIFNVEPDPPEPPWP